MAANTIPCGKCRNYDVIKRGPKDTGMGWCAKMSVYPYKESPGQVFPAGVRRAENPEDLAQPKIVRSGEVVGMCTFVQPVGGSRDALEAQMKRK